MPVWPGPWGLQGDNHRLERSNVKHCNVATISFWPLYLKVLPGLFFGEWVERLVERWLHTLGVFRCKWYGYIIVFVEITIVLCLNFSQMDVMCVRIAWSLHEPRKGLSMADFQVGSIEFWNRRLKFLKFFKEKNPQKSLFSEHQHQWTHIQFQQKNRIKSCFLYFVFTYERLFLLFITPTASLASYSHCRSWRLVGTSCDFRLGPHLGVRHWLETTLSKLESDFGVISEEVEKTHWCWSIVLECFGWFSCTDVVWSKDFKVIYVIYIYDKY